MITYIVVTALLASLSTVAGLLPALSLPVPGDTWGSLLVNAYSANRILPVATVMLALFAYYGWKAALTAWDGLLWLYHQFWGSS